MPKSIIPMKNGSAVLRADLSMHEPTGDVNGVVLAQWHDQFVTWQVSRTVVMGPEFDAFWGHYFENFQDALASYNNRREEGE